MKKVLSIGLSAVLMASMLSSFAFAQEDNTALVEISSSETFVESIDIRDIDFTTIQEQMLPDGTILKVEPIDSEEFSISSRAITPRWSGYSRFTWQKSVGTRAFPITLVGEVIAGVYNSGSFRQFTSVESSSLYMNGSSIFDLTSSNASAYLENSNLRLHFLASGQLQGTITADAGGSFKADFKVAGFDVSVGVGTTFYVSKYVNMNNVYDMY